MNKPLDVKIIQEIILEIRGLGRGLHGIPKNVWAE
jgi:hypothetical protein